MQVFRNRITEEPSTSQNRRFLTVAGGFLLRDSRYWTSEMTFGADSEWMTSLVGGYRPCGLYDGFLDSCNDERVVSKISKISAPLEKDSCDWALSEPVKLRRP